MSDSESIFFSCWTQQASSDLITINEKDGAKHRQLLTCNVVFRKLTYQEKDWNGEIVNIDQKAQPLINYFIDTFSSE